MNCRWRCSKRNKSIQSNISRSTTREEVEACSADSNKSIILNKKKLDIQSERKEKNYIPLSRRQDRPNAAFWLIKNYPQLSDGQISKLVGSTKKTVSLIRGNNYWNSSNLAAKDPVVASLCSQVDIKDAQEKALRRIARKKKEAAKEAKKKEKEIE